MRDERGAATVLVTVVVAALGALALVGLAVGALRAHGVRVQGAADLAAVAGATAQTAHQDACAAAHASARANRVAVTQCRVRGDEVEFVVSVEAVLEVPGWPSGLGRLTARAHAGVVTGAPEPD